MNLSELYAKVCEKRPEAVAECGYLDREGTGRLHHTAGGWWAGDHAGVPEKIVEALILKHWLGMLPECVFAGRSSFHDVPGHEYLVFDNDEKDHDRWHGSSLVEALAAYLLEAP